MLHKSLFFTLFPPPKFLTMPHAGLEISDDALRCVEYKSTTTGFLISKYAQTAMPTGLLDNGEIKDEKRFIELLKSFVTQNKLSYVKVSLPEEKVYLFQTDVPGTDVKSVTQHVEFKLEENVPLSVADAVFYFDILPANVTGNVLRASVSVVSRVYVEKMFGILRGVGLVPIAFEVAAKSIAKCAVIAGSDQSVLLVHMMNKKTGIYIVSGGVVCFSSTFSWGRADISDSESSSIDPIIKEIHRVYSYWATRPNNHSSIVKIILVGKDVSLLEEKFHDNQGVDFPPLASADVWCNVFDLNKYIPPVSREESLEYAVAAGLALP